MINLKITMNNGNNYNLSHIASTIPEWIKKVLMPFGNQKRWAEIFPGFSIQTDNISEVRLLSEEEVEVLKNKEPTAEAENNIGTQEKEETPIPEVEEGPDEK